MTTEPTPQKLSDEQIEEIRARTKGWQSYATKIGLPLKTAERDRGNLLSHQLDGLYKQVKEELDAAKQALAAKASELAGPWRFDGNTAYIELPFALTAEEVKELYTFVVNNPPQADHSGDAAEKVEAKPPQPKQPAFVCPKCGCRELAGDGDYATDMAEPIVCGRSRCDWVGIWDEVAAAQAKEAAVEDAGIGADGIVSDWQKAYQHECQRADAAEASAASMREVAERTVSTLVECTIDSAPDYSVLAKCRDELRMELNKADAGATLLSEVERLRDFAKFIGGTLSCNLPDGEKLELIEEALKAALDQAPQPEESNA